MGKPNLVYRTLRFGRLLIARCLVMVIYYPLYLFLKTKSDSAVFKQSDLVFIIGAPRTGSTILYQALTNCYDIRYIDNLAAGWYRQLPFGMWLSNKKFGLSAHNNYLANYGNTIEFGQHAPSECGEFWYRWLPLYEHFVDAGVTSELSVDQIRKELSEISGMFGLPILFKNLNMGQRLRLIKEFAPNAKFIVLRRDPRFTVRSILNARRKSGAKPHEWWSVRPKNFRDLIDLPEVEMCAAQVFYLERQIEEDLALFPEENVAIVQYNELSEQKLENLAEWVGLTRKSEAHFPEFTKDDLADLSSKELMELESAIKQYEFDKDVFC